MTVVPNKRLLLLSDDKSTIFNSTKALCWSLDNKVILCCAEKCQIVTMVTGPYQSTKTDVFITRVEETPEISSLQKFSFASELLKFKASMNNLSEGDRQRLTLDPSLTEDPLYPNMMLNTFKHMVCSPLCHKIERPETLIAAVTFDHRVVIIGEKAEGWSFILDCSPIIKEQILSNIMVPITLGETMALSEYIDLVHKMCTVELEWSTLFSVNGGTGQSFFLLFTGSRSGVVTVWKFCFPFGTKEDFTFQCTDTYTSEVTALSWLSREANKGLLAVGYLDGSIRVISVCVSLDISASCVTVEEIFAALPGDGISISDLAWAQVDKTMTALIGCKQYFLSLYCLHDTTVRLVSHSHMDVSLPLTSISTFGDRGVASSQDGALINFHCKYESGEITLHWSTFAVTCMPSSSDLPWLCLGVALSPNSGLCLSAHRISHTYKTIETKRKFLNRQMIALSIPFPLTLKSVKDVLSSGSPPFSVQDIMINIRLHIQQITKTNGSLQDILQIYTEINDRDDIQSIQIVSDILLFLKDSSTCKGSYLKELEWVPPAYEKVTEKLIVKHIESCLQNVSSTPSSNELSIMKAMLSWISARNVISSDITHALDLTKLNNICQQSAYQHCAICGSVQYNWFSASQVCQRSSDEALRADPIAMSGHVREEM